MKKAIDHLKRSDPVISEIIDRVGEYRIEFREPDFETLVKSIIYQQLSGRVASVIFERLGPRGGRQLTPAGRPEAAARAHALAGPFGTEDRLYPRSGPAHARRRASVFEELPASPTQEVIERLTQVKGIGVWTVHMFLIFALRRTDVLPDRRPGNPQRHSQSLRPGGIAHARRNRSHGRALAALLHGGELVSLAQPGAERELVTGLLLRNPQVVENLCGN